MSTTFSPTKESGSIDITVQNTRASQEDIPANRSIDKEGQGGTLSTRTVHGLSWLLVVLAILSSILLYALDNTIMANIIPVVADVFHDTDKLPWLSVGFMIGGLGVVLSVGKLYGLFNAKYLYITSMILFLAGSALCGAAPTMNAFIVGRVIAGIGGNGLYFGVMTLISVNTNEKERPMYLGLIGLLFGIGTVAGPVIGGAFAQSDATWRWGFYLNLCVGGVFAPVYIWLLPGYNPRGTQKLKSRLREFDYVGALLSLGTLTCIVMAINFGGTVYAWNSGQIIVLFIISGACAILFAVQQTLCLMTGKPHRMFPVDFLKIKEYVLLFILMSASNALFIAIYYIPTYFQFTRGDSPLRSAVRLLPIICFTCGTIVANGGLMSKYGYYQQWYIVGSALALIGGVLLSRISVDTPAAQIYGYEVILGIGTGCYVQAGHAVMQAIVEPSMLSCGITFMVLAQLLGVTLGLSIAGAVFINLTLKGLQHTLPHVARDQIHAAILGTSGDFFKSLPPEVAAACLQTIVVALQKIFIPVYVAAGISLVLSPFLSSRKVNMALGGSS